MELFGIWVAAFLTLCIYSFLYRDNPFYRFAEHLFVGISVGYGIVIAIHQGVIPLAWEPLSEAMSALWTETTAMVGAWFGTEREVTPETRNALWGLFKIIPIVIGLLFFARLSPRHNWLVRYPIAILIGFGAGIAIPNMLQANIFEQTRATIEPFGAISSGNPTSVGIVGAVLMVVGVLCIVTYFLFSIERRSSFKWVSMIGTGLLIIGFGLVVGSTIMNGGLTFWEIIGAVLMVVGVLCIVTYFLFSVERRSSFKWVSMIGVGLLIIGFGTAFGNTIMTGGLTPWDTFGAVLMVIGVICTLTYFFFSVEHSGPINWLSKVGIAFLMIGFGAAFGNTVMGRVALMIHRVGFLINEWLGSIGALF